METSLVVAISSAASMLIGVLVTKGVDAIIRLRKATAEEGHYDDNRIDTNYQFLVGNLTGQLEKMRVDIERIHADHMECVRTLGELRGRVEGIEKTFWRHDNANKQQVDLLKFEVVKTIADGGLK